MSNNYYEILGVSANASVDEITSAWKKLIRKFHPDLNPGFDSAKQKLKWVNKAFEVLSNAEARKVYDQNLREQLESRKKRQVSVAPPVVNMTPEIKTDGAARSRRQFHRRKDNSKLIAFLAVVGIVGIVGIVAAIMSNNSDSKKKNSTASKPSSPSSTGKASQPVPKSKSASGKSPSSPKVTSSEKIALTNLARSLAESIPREVGSYFESAPDLSDVEVENLIFQRFNTIIRNSELAIPPQDEVELLNQLSEMIRLNIRQFKFKRAVSKKTATGNNGENSESSGGKTGTRTPSTYSPFDGKRDKVAAAKDSKYLIPLPDDTELETAKKNLKFLFQDSIQNIESLSSLEMRLNEYTILAKQLVKEVDLADKNDAEKYACFWLASDIARLSRDMDFALETLSLFESRFDVDLDSWRLAFFEDWGAVVNKSYESLLARAAARQKIAMYAFQVGGGIFKRGNKDIAEKVFLLGIELFKKNGASDLAAFARDVLKDLYGQRDDQVTEITNEIAANPNQPDKLLLLGKLRCFEQLKWSTGLPLLAKSNSPKLKQAARMDLYADTDEEFELTADYWWDLSDNTANPKHSAAMRIRAVHQYNKLLPAAGDLKTKKYQNRINAVGRAESLGDLYRNSSKWNDGLIGTANVANKEDKTVSFATTLNRFGLEGFDFSGNHQIEALRLRRSSSFTILVWFRGSFPRIRIDSKGFAFTVWGASVSTIKGEMFRDNDSQYGKINRETAKFYRQFAFVYDRGKVKIVINGKAPFEDNVATTPTSDMIDSIRASSYDVGKNFSRIRFYDRALTEKEIRRIYVFECLPPDFYDLLKK